MKRKTFLIIDDDLNFVFWLGQALDGAGHEALPARTVADAKKLLNELNVNVDLLIARRSISGLACLIESLTQSQGDLKVIAIAEDRDGLSLEAQDFDGFFENYEWLSQNVAASLSHGRVAPRF